MIATAAILLAPYVGASGTWAQEATIRPTDPSQDASAQNSPPDDAQSPDRQALLKLKDIYEEAAANGNPSQLKPYLDPEFTGVMVTSEAVQSFADVQTYWDKISAMLGAGGRYKTKITVDGRANIAGELAIAHGTSDDVAITGSGKEFHFSGQWTAVCRRGADGEWKILRIHGSMNPLDNVFAAAAGSMARIFTGVAATVVGLVAGFFLARFFQRKPKY